MAEKSDEALVKMAQEGDRQAFMILYERYVDKVYRRVKSKIPVPDVEDVTQEVFIAVIRSLDGFEHRSSFSTWLYTLTNRQIADFYRKRNRKKVIPETINIEDAPIGITAVPGKQSRIDDTLMLQDALNRLPEHYQEVILLRFADGLTFPEIAEQSERSLEATKSLYRRAIDAIREKLDRG